MMRTKLGCRHTEGLDDQGNPVRFDRHDCAYVEARNRLIPEAERRAMERVGAEVGLARSNAFSRFFFEEMDLLWRHRNAH